MGNKIVLSNSLAGAVWDADNWQMKVIMEGISKIPYEISRAGDDIPQIQIKLQDIDNNRGNYIHVKQAVRDCIRVMVNIEYYNDENRILQSDLPLFSEIVEDKLGNNGTFSMIFNERLIPHLASQTGKFTIMNRDDFLKLKSYKAQKLYMLICRSAMSKSFSISFEKFRDVFNVGNKHPRKDHLKDRFIQKAVDEVNKKIPYLGVSYTITQKGIKFNFNKVKIV